MKMDIKNIALGAFVIATLAVSCADNSANAPKEEDSKEVAKDSNEVKFKTDSSEDKASFVVDAAAGNLTEIKLAELGRDKSSNKEIKELSKHLITDHTAALNDLKVIASNKAITVPAEDPEAAKEKAKDLNEKKPADFDRAWVDELLEKHKKTIADYEKAQGNLNDPEIKAWIDNVLPKVRTHLDKLLALDSKIKK